MDDANGDAQPEANGNTELRVRASCSNKGSSKTLRSHDASCYLSALTQTHVQDCRWMTRMEMRS